MLSSFSACALIAICGLLLRSQTLLSAARSPNFEPIDPSIESTSVSKELIPVVVLLIVFLASPGILAIILSIIIRFHSKKAERQISENANFKKEHASAASVNQDPRTDLELRHSSCSERSMTAEPGNVKISFLPDPDDTFSQSSAHDTFSYSLRAPLDIGIRGQGTFLPDPDDVTFNAHRNPWIPE